MHAPNTPGWFVRLIIGDVDEADLEFTDAEIDGFLALEGGNVRLAAAQALDTLATREAYILKATTIAGVSTNGPAVATSLRDHAERLRAAAEEAADGVVEIVEPNWDRWTWSALLARDAARDN